ncbi:MAG: hypothetical protein U5K56_17790 [Halioglobus sp.]|nr:hypothetical protein [Halioglobus sp.]
MIGSFLQMIIIRIKRQTPTNSFSEASAMPVMTANVPQTLIGWDTGAPDAPVDPPSMLFLLGCGLDGIVVFHSLSSFTGGGTRAEQVHARRHTTGRILEAQVQGTEPVVPGNLP